MYLEKYSRIIAILIYSNEIQNCWYISTYILKNQPDDTVHGLKGIKSKNQHHSKKTELMVLIDSSEFALTIHPCCISWKNALSRFLDGCRRGKRSDPRNKVLQVGLKNIFQPFLESRVSVTMTMLRLMRQLQYL